MLCDHVIFILYFLKNWINFAKTIFLPDVMTGHGRVQAFPIEIRLTYTLGERVVQLCRNP